MDNCIDHVGYQQNRNGIIIHFYILQKITLIVIVQILVQQGLIIIIIVIRIIILKMKPDNEI